jgi:hypothetical protein
LHKFDQCFCKLSGDPLYDVGGQPMCFDSEHEDESFAEDGYKCISVYVDVDGLVLSSHYLFSSTLTLVLVVIFLREEKEVV